MPAASELLAGGFAGAVSIAVTQPLDTIRIRLMSTPSALGSTAPPYRGIMQCLTATFRQEGVRGLFKGIGSQTVTVGAINAVIFFTYESSLRSLASARGLGEYQEFPVSDAFLAGSVAGLACSFIISPTEYTKSLAQANRRSKGTVAEEFANIRGRIKSYGWLGAHGPSRGLLATMLRDVPGFGLWFYIYEDIYRRCGKTATASLHAGGIAGVLSSVLVYPMDLIKTRWQTEVPGTYRSLRHCFRVSVAEEGWSCLFNGCGATCLRAWPQNAVLFAIYELSKRELSQYLP